MMKGFYIAYGSNLNVRQMKYRCPDAKIIGVSEIKDYRLLFRGSKTGSYLTIEPAEGFSVPVAVWAVSAADERNLDRYEGFPHFYYKKSFTLNLGRDVECFAYIMHEDRPMGIPTRLYVEICAEGYENFGFDTAILADAVEYSMEEVYGRNAAAGM